MVGTLQRHWRGLATSIALALVPFWEIVAGRRTALYGDAQEQFVPFYAAVWDLIRAGHAPWWHPGVFSGFSLVGAGQSAAFYPPTVIFGWLEETNAARWWLVLHLLVGAVGMYAWCYSRWRSTPGAVVAAVSLSLCSFHVLHLVHMNFFAQASWVPLTFLGIDLLAERWTTGRAAVLAFPLAMIVVLGGPQVLWMTCLALGAYAAFGSGHRRDRLRSDLRIAAGLALGLGLGAVQLIPAWLYSKASVRPELSAEEAFTYAMQPKHLLNLVFPYAYGGATHPAAMSSPFRAGPYPMHEVLPYAGVTVLVLALIGFWARRGERMVQGCLAIGVAGAFVALAGSSPLGDAIYRFLPLAPSFRGWGRVAFLTQLSLAVLAAAGVQAVLEQPRRYVGGLLAAVAAVAVLATAAPHVDSIAEVLAPGAVGLLARVVPVLLVVLLLTAVLLHSHHPRVGPVLLVAVVAIDLVTYAQAGEWRRDGLSPADSAALYRSDAPEFGRPFDAPGGTDRWASNSAFRGIALITGTETVLGHDPLLPKDYSETVAALSYMGFPTRPDLWTSASLSDVLRITTLGLPPDITPTAEGWRRAGIVPGQDFVRWVRRPRLADAYLVGAADTAGLATIRAALDDEATPWSRRALVEAPLEVTLDAPGVAGRVTRSDVTGDGEIDLVADRDALLVVSYAWLDGWEATVDGDAVPVVRTDGLVLGIPVPAGEHTVRLRFVPPGLRAGAAISLLSLLALVGAAPLHRRLVARRRAPAPGPA